MKICVIGAGIVGCATAWALVRAGHSVELVDEKGGPAQGTSFANGAQLSYSYVEPLASPATLRALPALLLSPTSPLRLRPRADWRQWRWGLRFLAACTSAQNLRGTAALLALATQSRETLEGWLADEAWPCSFARNGKLVLCPDEASLAHQRRQVALQSRWGCRQDVLGRAECVAREPALAGYASGFAGGVWTATECVADPAALAAGMVAGFVRLGGRARFGARVAAWRHDGARVSTVCLDSGEALTADAFVLATGPAAPAMARRLGIYLPVYPIKGYSLTFNARRGRTLPSASVTDLSRKTVFAPLGGQLRVAAMAEVGELGLDVPGDRIARMWATVETVFPGLVDASAETRPWAGLRPATPTSVPIVERAARWENVWLNTGHGGLGLTLAAGSAAALARQIGART